MFDREGLKMVGAAIAVCELKKAVHAQAPLVA
jgi:hypothetical protein